MPKPIYIYVMGGRLKGRKIKPPHHVEFKPVLAIVKKAIFDIIQFDIKPEHRFLDLFGGSGSVGIEAYSRGMDTVYINEYNKYSFQAIEENVNNLKIADNVTVFNKDFRRMLDYILAEKMVLNHVFVAPPYKEVGYYKYVIDFFAEHPELLAEDGNLIVEYFKKVEIDPGPFNIYKDKKYGSTKVYFLRKRAAHA